MFVRENEDEKIVGNDAQFESFIAKLFSFIYLLRFQSRKMFYVHQNVCMPEEFYVEFFCPL